MTNRSSAISSVLLESLKKAEELHRVKRGLEIVYVHVERQNEHMTANERLIDLLAVYMSNKVLLPGCNSSKISSGGEG